MIVLILQMAEISRVLRPGGMFVASTFLKAAAPLGTCTARLAGSWRLCIWEIFLDVSMYYSERAEGKVLGGPNSREIQSKFCRTLQVK